MFGEEIFAVAHKLLEYNGISTKQHKFFLIGVPKHHPGFFRSNKCLN